MWKKHQITACRDTNGVKEEKRGLKDTSQILSSVGSSSERKEYETREGKQGVSLHSSTVSIHVRHTHTHTHTHIQGKRIQRKEGCKRGPRASDYCKTVSLNRLYTSGLSSAPTAPAHNPRPYSQLELEAAFIVSKGLHGNNTVCQKRRHLFRVRENTFPQKHPAHPKKKTKKPETPVPCNSPPIKYQL